MIPFLKKYLGKIYIPIAWTLVIGVLLTLPGSMLPSEKGFSIPQFDKLVHIGMFGGFVFLWCLFFSTRAAFTPAKLLRLFFLVFILANAYGIGMEFVQQHIPMRDYDEADMVADMIGAGLAYGLCNIWLVIPPRGKTTLTSGGRDGN
jgi:VanZ family protein